MVVGPVNNTVAFVSPQQGSVNPAAEARNMEQVQPRQAPSAESQRADNNRDESARRSESRGAAGELAASARNDNAGDGGRGTQLDITV